MPLTLFSAAEGALGVCGVNSGGGVGLGDGLEPLAKALGLIGAVSKLAGELGGVTDDLGLLGRGIGGVSGVREMGAGGLESGVKCCE